MEVPAGAGLDRGRAGSVIRTRAPVIRPPRARHATSPPDFHRLKKIPSRRVCLEMAMNSVEGRAVSPLCLRSNQFPAAVSSRSWLDHTEYRDPKVASSRIAA